MKSHAHGARSALASLAILVLLFAPATHDVVAGAAKAPEADLGDRVLAPTVGEAMVALAPRLPVDQLQAARQGPRPGPVPPAVGSAAGALLILSLARAARRRSPDGVPRAVVAPRLVPRAPPVPQVA